MLIINWLHILLLFINSSLVIQELAHVVCSDYYLHGRDFLTDSPLLVTTQLIVPLAVPLVFFQVYILFEGVQFLVELSSDLDLSSHEIKLVVVF